MLKEELCITYMSVTIKLTRTAVTKENACQPVQLNVCCVFSCWPRTLAAALQCKEADCSYLYSHLLSLSTRSVFWLSTKMTSLKITL